VIENLDPSGRNVHPRLTLTFSAIAEAARAVVTVIGADKADALAAVDAREELPATTIDSERVLWLCDPAAASRLVQGWRR
jgi:6-phosphogluconolactonase/glucosamine-6-phosphate isomerase/deaminase